MIWNEKYGILVYSTSSMCGRIQSNIWIVLTFCIELGHSKKQQNDILIFLFTLECLMPLTQSNYMNFSEAIYQEATEVGFLKLLMSVILV